MTKWQVLSGGPQSGCVEFKDPSSTDRNSVWSTLILKIRINDTVVPIELDDLASVLDLKRAIEKRSGIPSSAQRLSFSLTGEPLLPEEFRNQGKEGERVTLSYLGVCSGTYITVEVRVAAPNHGTTLTPNHCDADMLLSSGLGAAPHPCGGGCSGG